MKKKRVVDIACKQYRKLLASLHQMRISFDESSIHCFRVRYKKMRAFFRLISFVDKQSSSVKIPKKISTLYKYAGNIRDLQLQYQLIDSLDSNLFVKPILYLNYLQINIKYSKQLCKSALVKNKTAVFTHKMPVKINQKIDTIQYLKYVKFQWDTIDAIIESGDLCDVNCHTIRKIFKDLFYNYSRYQGRVSASIAAGIWRRKPILFYQKLLDQLGAFQDSCTSIKLLSAYQIDNSIKASEENIEWLADFLLAKKNKLKQRLVQDLQNELQFVNQHRIVKKLAVT